MDIAGAEIPTQFLPASTDIAAVRKTQRKPGWKKRVDPAITTDDPDPVLPERWRTPPTAAPVSRSGR